jgi:hypothetical protein
MCIVLSPGNVGLSAERSEWTGATSGLKRANLLDTWNFAG